MQPEELERMSAQAGIQGQLAQNEQIAQQYMLDNQERGLVELQLEVDTIIEDIHHKLREDKLVEEDGRREWKPIPKKSERTLSDWGVDRIMRIIHFYINKNTLLSNFDEQTIKRLMYKFVTELNDLLLNKYEVLFMEPTFEECREILEYRISERMKKRMFAYEVAGKNKPTEKEVNKEILKEIVVNNMILMQKKKSTNQQIYQQIKNATEDDFKENYSEFIELALEREVLKIKSEQRDRRVSEYGLMIAELEVQVLSTLNRAWKGEERGSIRRRTSISELIGNSNQNQQHQLQNRGKFSWGR